MTNDIVLSPEKRNILEDLTDMIKSEADIRHWLGKPIQHFNADEMQTSAFKNLVQNPDRVEGQYVAKPAFAVKKITVFSDKLADMRNCIIYDVPGFDSPTAIHMEQTRERMDLADAVILIANASKPSLTGPQVNIFRSSVDSDGIPFNEKIFVFANRANESRNLQYNMGVLKDDLHKYSILRSVNGDRLIAGSAFAYLCRLSGSQDESAQQAITNLQNNGITDGMNDELGQARTSKKEFLDKIESIIPWDTFVEIIEPCYYKGERGNKPYPLELMLRIFLLQNLYDLADMRVMTEVIDSRAFSEFCGVTSPDEVPDGDTIGRFRNLLEKNGIQEKIFASVVKILEERALILKKEQLWILL